MNAAKALKVFYDQSKKLSNKLPSKFDDFYDQIKNSKDKSFSLIIPTLENAIEIMKDDMWYSDSKVEKSMIDLANKSLGQIPSVNGFVQALSSNFSQLGLREYAALTLDTAGDLITKTKDVGEGVLTTLKTSKYLIPVAAGLAVVILLSNLKVIKK